MGRHRKHRAKRIEQVHGKPQIMVKDGKGWVQYHDPSRPQRRESTPRREHPDYQRRPDYLNRRPHPRRK